ncbi:DUF456 domain-containing protein [Natrialbaceae archaeon GCM10025810]|uniref:DUF456 domain-containing protein n=1 Tax=Halovalidus salilacus TaxID=3075124 RepID=UPI003608A168
MSDRSEEVTTTRDSSDSPSTEELLEETDRLLSGTETNAGASGDATTESAADSPSELEAETDPTATATDDAASSDSSRLSFLPSLPSLSSRSRSRGGRSLQSFFSPKAFFTLILVFAAALFAGGMAIPVAGSSIGLFAAAFVLGLVTSKRRYLEVTAAGTAVGAVAAVLNHVVITVAGSGSAVVAVGASLGLVACLVGYYFGRDLKTGLSKDLEGVE